LSEFIIFKMQYFESGSMKQLHFELLCECMHNFPETVLAVLTSFLIFKLIIRARNMVDHGHEFRSDSGSDNTPGSSILPEENPLLWATPSLQKVPSNNTSSTFSNSRSISLISKPDRNGKFKSDSSSGNTLGSPIIPAEDRLHRASLSSQKVLNKSDHGHVMGRVSKRSSYSMDQKSEHSKSGSIKVSSPESQSTSQLYESRSVSSSNGTLGSSILPPEYRLHAVDLSMIPSQIVNHEDDIECAICLKPLRLGARKRVLVCGHDLFHSQCIALWFKDKDTCPICRRKQPVHKENDDEDSYNVLYLSKV